MKYDIYFHNDFDGRACAAVVLAFLRSRGDSIERYVAMTYGKEKAWYNDNFFAKGNPAIVVDFTYHPKAAWWFDHHSTTFKKPEWKKFFKADKQHHLDPGYASCCGLVYAALKKDFGWKPSKHFLEFVKSADVIDGANYKTAEETFDMNEAGIEMNAYIEALDHTAKEDKRMIELMAEHSLAEVVKDPMIAPALKKLKAKVKKSLEYYKKNIKLYGKTSFIDLTRDPLNGLLRFAPYYFQPKIVYNARMKRKGTLWYFGVAANPWNRKANKFDLGTVMRQYKGGGHKDVGATEFHSRAEAMKAFTEVNALLNKK